MRHWRWLSGWLLSGCLLGGSALAADTRPNFLFVITDDQSWQHTSYEGYPYVKTPAFDRIAKEGVYFRHAFVSAPSCTESRAAILSGQHFWQTGSAALLWGEYPAALPNFMAQLKASGYVTAYTGKGWGPGAIPAGTEPTGKPVRQYLEKTDDADGYRGTKGYAENFGAFLNQHPASQPFFFWAGLFEPHRDYLELEGEKNRFEKTAAGDTWPPFMPQAGRAQKQMSRYLEEIEYADRELQRMLALLEKRGLLENTVVIYTSDNGMPFAGAKANLYRYGVQVPLAIWWKGHHHNIKSAELKDRDELISLVDIAPTVLQLAGLPPLKQASGQSLSPLLSLRQETTSVWKDRTFVLTGFERHYPKARSDFSTYPMRGLVTKDWFYIVNYHPERWPQGDPGSSAAPEYRDTFMAHLKTYKGKNIEPFFSDLLGKRPAQELYRWDEAPGARNNKAGLKEYETERKKLDQQLADALVRAQDPGVRNRDYFFKRFGKASSFVVDEEEFLLR